MRLDLSSEVPSFYLEDEQSDFGEFLDVASEVLQLVRDDVASLGKIYTPMQARAVVLRPLLRSLGWSEPFALQEIQQRRLVRFLRRLLRQRGTLQGIESMIRIILGIECVAVNLERSGDYGYPWPDDAEEWYTFRVIPPRELSEKEQQAVRLCVDYMKPSHTFCTFAPPIAHWELGISEIDGRARLH